MQIEKDLPAGRNAPIDKPLLEVHQLSVVLGRNQILSNVDLQLKRGAIHALIGPNGAGKTTFMRSIMGDMPHRGTIRFRFCLNQRIGYVPQVLDFDYTVPITVGDFIAIMLKESPIFLGGIKKIQREVEEALAVTETDHLIHRLIGSLSGGELRRVLLAQALVPTPELLLLDEPASNVDEIGVALFEKLLLSLRKERRLTVLMVAHNLSMIMRVADWVTGINREVTFEGLPQELRDPEKLEILFGATAGNIDRGSEGCD